jgi:hypothetical protein
MVITRAQLKVRPVTLAMIVFPIRYGVRSYHISFDVSPYVSMSPLLDHGILMVNHTLRQRFRDAAITIRIMDPNPPPRSDAAMVTTTPFQYDRLTKLIRIFKWLRGVRSFQIAVSADNDGAVQIVENIFHWSSLRSLHLGKMPG